jgi:hypothetical protein
MTDRVQDQTAGQLNELYWSSDRTVEDILSATGVGRHTLYASIQPLPANTSCTSCGEVLVFMNRMNRAAGVAMCSWCGVERTASDESRLEEPARQQGLSSSPANATRRLERWREELGDVPPARVALIGGAAALGMVAGAAAVQAWR